MPAPAGGLAPAQAGSLRAARRGRQREARDATLGKLNAAYSRILDLEGQVAALKAAIGADDLLDSELAERLRLVAPALRALLAG